uniref:Uncharacterized protein n=1 Tax=Anopheles melas TaxID=34690 RepID=A0A182U4T9_9DIPT
MLTSEWTFTASAISTASSCVISSFFFFLFDLSFCAATTVEDFGNASVSAYSTVRFVACPVRFLAPYVSGLISSSSGLSDELPSLSFSTTSTRWCCCCCCCLALRFFWFWLPPPACVFFVRLLADSLLDLVEDDPVAVDGDVSPRIFSRISRFSFSISSNDLPLGRKRLINSIDIREKKSTITMNDNVVRSIFA